MLFIGFISGISVLWWVRVNRAGLGWLVEVKVCSIFIKKVLGFFGSRVSLPKPGRVWVDWGLLGAYSGGIGAGFRQ